MPPPVELAVLLDRVVPLMETVPPSNSGQGPAVAVDSLVLRDDVVGEGEGTGAVGAGVEVNGAALAVSALVVTGVLAELEGHPRNAHCEAGGGCAADERVDVEDLVDAVAAGRAGLDDGIGKAVARDGQGACDVEAAGAGVVIGLVRDAPVVRLRGSNGERVGCAHALVKGNRVRPAVGVGGDDGGAQRDGTALADDLAQAVDVSDLEAGLAHRGEVGRGRRRKRRRGETIFQVLQARHQMPWPSFSLAAAVETIPEDAVRPLEPEALAHDDLPKVIRCDQSLASYRFSSTPGPKNGGNHLVDGTRNNVHEVSFRTGRNVADGTERRGRSSPLSFPIVPIIQDALLGDKKKFKEKATKRSQRLPQKNQVIPCNPPLTGLE